MCPQIDASLFSCIPSYFGIISPTNPFISNFVCSNIQKKRTSKNPGGSNSPKKHRPTSKEKKWQTSYRGDVQGGWHPWLRGSHRSWSKNLCTSARLRWGRIFDATGFFDGFVWGVFFFGGDDDILKKKKVGRKETKTDLKSIFCFRWLWFHDFGLRHLSFSLECYQLKEWYLGWSQKPWNGRMVEFSFL